MNTNFFVAEDEVFNPNKVLTRKEMDAFRQRHQKLRGCFKKR